MRRALSNRCRAGGPFLLALLGACSSFSDADSHRPPVRPDAIAVAIPGLQELSFLAKKNEANSGTCNGGNTSPPVSWAHWPAATKSFAIVMSDPDGGRGRGSVHWIAYNIPLETTSLAEGAGAAATTAFTHGKNSAGQEQYRGHCPSVGDRPHHYLIAVYALDLAPGALPAGLDRDRFIAAVADHSLGEASIALLYGR